MLLLFACTIALTLASGQAQATCPKKYEFSISTTWDGKPVSHPPMNFKLSAEDSSHVRLEVNGPFFNDPAGPPPNCTAGLPCWKLWQYEVAEMFFLGRKEKYLELEVSPYGMHLLLLLDGVRKPFKTKLPMQYTATINNEAKTWSGVAKIPIEYFPPNVRKMNAYAIHGPADQRKYESLYPATGTAGADFHALQFFKSFDFKSMFPPVWNEGPSPFWIKI